MYSHGVIKRTRYIQKSELNINNYLNINSLRQIDECLNVRNSKTSQAEIWPQVYMNFRCTKTNEMLYFHTHKHIPYI